MTCTRLYKEFHRIINELIAVIVVQRSALLLSLSFPGFHCETQANATAHYQPQRQSTSAIIGGDIVTSTKKL